MPSSALLERPKLEVPDPTPGPVPEPGPEPAPSPQPSAGADPGPAATATAADAAAGAAAGRRAADPRVTPGRARSHRAALRRIGGDPSPSAIAASPSEPTAVSNCASSVEPTSASVDERPPEMTVETWSK